MILIAPTEPARLKALGKSSLVPEYHGADVLWETADGRVHGVQRKEVGDFLSSVADGRLAKELGQMENLDGLRVLILEGKVDFVAGELDRRFGQRWSEQQFYGYLWSVMARGVWVQRSSHLTHTIALVEMLVGWSAKDRHSSTRIRPAAQSPWGQPGNREYGIHLLQGLPGVGVELATRIYDHFGGVPWMWGVTEQQLTEVEGIGKMKARSIYQTVQVAGDATVKGDGGVDGEDLPGGRTGGLVGTGARRGSGGATGRVRKVKGGKG